MTILGNFTVICAWIPRTINECLLHRVLRALTSRLTSRCFSVCSPAAEHEGEWPDLQVMQLHPRWRVWTD